MIARRLLVAALGGGAFSYPPFPTSWDVTREAANPVIVVAGGEPLEQYDPAPYLLAGSREVLVKGAARIYRYKDASGSLPFSGQNGGSAVINIGSSGAWDDTHALEPHAHYDSSANVIRAWYKGSGDGGTTWNWGYATAPGGTPNTYTKDAGNPILTASAINTKMGGAGVTDTAPFDVIPEGSTYHFYGYVQYDGKYQIVHMTGTDWDAPDVSTLTVLLAPASPTDLAATGSVFEFPTLHSPRYGMFYTWGPVSGSGRTIRVGKSDSLGSGWDFSDTTDIISPTSGWEVYHVYTPRLLRENTSPFLKPIVSGDEWTLFYSGADAGWAHSQTGIAYLMPE